MEVNNNHDQSQPQVLMASTVFPTPNSTSSLHEDQTQANDSDHEAFSNPNISFSNSPAKINNNNNNVVSETIINNLSHCMVCKCHCNDENYLGSFPPGYRFVPFDDELVVHYLRRKVLDQPLPQNKIREVDLYRHSPETLTEQYQGLGEKEWYFFTPRNRKYRNGTRPNRAAGSGYWKATGADKPITHKGIKVGSRKALVYYEGKAPEGKKTSWIMHEYRVEDPPKSRRGSNDMRLDDWVLCRVYKKCDKFVKVHQRGEEEREAVVSSKTYSDEASFLPTSGNGPEPYFFSETDELVDNYPKYVQPLLQNGVLYEIPQFTDDSLMKLAKYNNNLMSSHSYGGGGGRPVVPFTTPPVYSDHLRTLYPKEESTWGTSVSRGYQGDIYSGISNSDNCEIWSQYFSNTSNLDSLRSLETVMQNNPTNSPQMSPQN